MNMMKPPVLIRIFTVLLSCFLVLFGPETRAGYNRQTPERVIPFSIAISGGISLGSYEAGMNWALVTYLKSRHNDITRDEPGRPPPELMSAVGASAGSINALLSAITWCVDDNRLAQSTNRPGYQNTIGNNLFRSLWLNVGIDEMLPVNPSVYRQDDGLLTRAALDPAIDQIARLLRSNIFRSDCDLPMGMTVTRVDPAQMSIAGVEVENQRFMIPVRLQSVGKRGRIGIFSHMLNKQDPSLGNVIYLRQGLSDLGTYSITPEDLIRAILTSSAYPIAFGQVSLAHCSPLAGNDPNAAKGSCPPGYQPRIDNFIDGGLFDNIPLGIGKLLAEPDPYELDSRKRWQISARPYSYVYLDPDNRRQVMRRDATGTSAPERIDNRTEDTGFMDYGVLRHLKFLGGAINTGRNYELYNVLKGGDWTNQIYGYTCRLIEELDAASDTGKCQPRLRPDSRTCNQVLHHQLRPKVKLGRKQQQQAAACIVQESIALESVYYGFTGATLAPAQITKKREQLIRHMRLLASASGKPQLALRIASLTQDKLGDRQILLTRRFAPITGDMLGAFGAFIDRPFREYDYYAGIYDAVQGLADFYCKHQPAYERCLAGETIKIHRKLGVSTNTDALGVFRLLGRLEHPEYGKPGSVWHWLTAANERPYKGNLVAIFKALSGDFDPSRDEVYEEPEFTIFIKRLFAAGYDTRRSSQFMRRIHRLKGKDPISWYYPLSARASSRLLEMEQDNPHTVGSVMRGVMGLGAFAVHSFVTDEESKLLIRSAAPAGAWQNWLPYEFGVDLRNGGLVMSWLPGVNMGKYVSLDMRLTPAYLNEYAGNDIWFSQIDVFLHFRRSGIISSYGFGPTYTYTWDSWPGASRNNIGVTAYIALLQDKLRLSFGHRSFSTSFAGDSTYVSLTVMDIPGLVYWLTKGK